MAEEIRKLDLLDGSTISVRFIWTCATASGLSYYPQAVRAWPEDRAERLRPHYEKMERIYAGQLAAIIPLDPTCIFAPPSRHPFAATYRDACKAKYSVVHDISGRFRRANASVLAGEKDITTADIYGALTYERAGDEANISSILMVDDVVAGMKTSIAAFSRLVEAGMPLDAEIAVASLLRLN